MTFILNQNGTDAIPLGQVKRLYIEHGENWYKIIALVHPCDNDKMSLGNIFEEADAIQIDLEECIIHLQTNKIMTPNEIRKLLGLEEIKCQ